MPSTKDKKNLPFQRACSDPYGAGGEPPGEPSTPRMGGESRSGLRGELVEEAVERSRLRRTIEELSSEEREQLAGALLDQLVEDREQLPAELNERLIDSMLGGLMPGKRSEQELLGRDGLLGELTRRMVNHSAYIESVTPSRSELLVGECAKHFTLQIAGGAFSYQRNQAQIDEEALLERIYLIRTQEPATGSALLPSCAPTSNSKSMDARS
jgi:hypothetical protein